MVSLSVLASPVTESECMLTSSVPSGRESRRVEGSLGQLALQPGQRTVWRLEPGGRLPSSVRDHQLQRRQQPGDLCVLFLVRFTLWRLVRSDCLSSPSALFDRLDLLHQHS